MPNSPPRLCSTPGCGGKVREGKCDRCGPKKRQADKNRPNFRQRGYTTEWTNYSLRYRQENPLCVLCLEEGRVVASECVDHIIPHRGNMELFWDTENHRALCFSHHNAKSATERRS